MKPWSEECAARPRPPRRSRRAARRVHNLQRLRAEAGANEVAILSTCNRTELYCAQDRLDAERLVEWVARFHGMTADEIRRSSYLHQDAGAVNHMMRVAAGQDSLVLGEPQILGQMKDAWQAARTAGKLDWGTSSVAPSPPKT